MKALAVPLFYIVYSRLYGSIDNLDTGKFYHDAVLISKIAKNDLPLYLKILFGFQNDSRYSYDYYRVYETLNWDNGTMKDFLYNDNRIVIRVHSLLNFIAWDSYFVHALFSCFMSFIGSFLIVGSFRQLFPGKDLWAFLSFCFFPALWFHTGALLKEGLSLFVLGATLFLLRQLFERKLPPLKFPTFLFLLFVCVLLKAYLLGFAVVCFSLLFAAQRWLPPKFQVAAFLFSMSLSILFLNSLSLLWKQRSLLDAAFKQERIFSGVAKGGIFLHGPDRFIRLAYDSSSVKPLDYNRRHYSIRKNVAYMYWTDAQSVDTLYCPSNTDTTSVYTLAYIIKPSQSNLRSENAGSTLHVIGGALYNCLCYPVFSPHKTAMQWVMSLENIVIFLILLSSVVGLILFKGERLPIVVFLVFSLGVCLLVGITSPNGGAIFRYRSPAIPFLFLACLYYLDNYRDFLGRRNPGV